MSVDTARAAAAAEETGRSVHEAAPVAFMVLDEHLVCTFMNSAAEHLTGFSLAELQQRGVHALFPSSRSDGTSAPGSDGLLFRVLARQAGERGEELLARRDGSRYLAVVAAEPTRLDGRVTGLALEIGAVTHRQEGGSDAAGDQGRRVRELEEQTKRLLTVFHAAPSFLAVSRGPDHVFELANPAYAQVVGHRAVLGRPVREALPEVVDQGILGLLDEVYRTGEPYVGEEMPILLQRTPGAALEEHVFNLTYQALTDSEGAVTGVLAHGVDVTDQVRLRERLQVAESHYRQLVTSSPLGVYVLDTLGRFAEVNPAGERLLGRPAADVRGRSFEEVLAAESVDVARRAVEGVLAGRQNDLEIALDVLRASGECRSVVVTVSALVTGGTVTGVHGIARDVTEQLRTERALQESEEQFRLIAENVREVFWIFRPDFSEVLYVSPQYEEIWGRSVASVHADARSFVEAVHPEDRSLVEHAMERVATCTMPGLEYRVIHPDGAIRWVLTRAFPVVDDAGRTYRIVGTTVDITTRKAAELAREESERRLQQILDAIPIGVFLADATGQLLWHNAASQKSWGELRLVVPDGDPGSGGVWREAGQRPAAAEWALARALRGEAVAGQLVDVEAVDGTRRTIQYATVPLRDAAGGITGAIAVHDDVTDARERDAHTRLLAAAVEGLHEGVAMVDLQSGQLLYSNPALGRVLGFDPASPERPSLADLQADGGQGSLVDIRAAVARQGGWSGRLRQRRLSDGVEVDLDVTLGCVEKAGAKQRVLFAITRDVTEQLAAEQQLRRAERLASIGTLVGGVAHELNNPLSAIVGLTQLLLLDAQAPALREDLETIRHESERMAKIVSDLRVLTRDTQEESKKTGPVVLNDAVRYIVRTRAYVLRTHNILLQENLADDLPPVQIDCRGIEQVLLNLIVNAEQAVCALEGERQIRVRTRRTAAGACLEVVDNGTGIIPEHLERIFDPFFTTKPPGEGTGLGLPLVSRIVTEHGGRIHVTSTPGAGTTVRVDLRSTSAVPEAPSAAVAAEPPARSRLRILVVDDEDAVRRVLVRYLGRRGHDVEAADDGRRALELVDAAPGGYDVILSDLRMPGLGGDQLLAHLRARGDALERRLVFLTGDTATEHAQRILQEAQVPVLTKPLDLAAVAEVLERWVVARP